MPSRIMSKTDKTIPPSKNKGQNKQHLRPTLKPWKPGESGNPGGRPKHSISIMQAVKSLLGQPCQRDEYKVDGQRARRWAEVCAESLLVNFIEGNPAAIKQVLERVEGLVTPHSNPDNNQQVLQVLVGAMLECAGVAVEPEEDEEELEYDPELDFDD